VVFCNSPRFHFSKLSCTFNILYFKGIRSLHFRNSILSIGTGIGTILFYDVRANKFLHTDLKCTTDETLSSSPNSNQLKLETKRGWIVLILILI
jgi:hypothetical protein